MAIKKLGRNVPIPRGPRSSGRHELSEYVYRRGDVADQVGRGDHADMAPPESERWSQFPVIAQEDAWKTCSPYFCVVQWWLPEVEGCSVGRYKFLKLLGAGSYGRVYASAGEDGTLSAVKVLSKSQIRGAESIQAITDECDCLSQLNHPNICAFKGTILGVNSFYLFMEFAGSTTLYTVLYRSGPLDLRQTQHIFLAILQGTDHMHERRIAHCDLKPGNIVISEEGTPKIVDFGLALKICEKKVIAPRGTFPFIAPEPILDQGKAYDLAKGDMWSLGVLLLEMLCGVDKVSRMLGWKRNASMTIHRVMQFVSFLDTHKALEASIRVNLGSAAGHCSLVLHSMMHPHPQKRWDAKTALLMLFDAWR